jgi:phosphoribosyl 1,2-cyclic phosphodiesterase
MMSLITEPNFHESGKRYFRDFSPGDDFYQLLIDTHRDLSESQSAMLNAKLILILANHIGDISVLREAMQVARDSTAAA